MESGGGQYCRIRFRGVDYSCRWGGFIFSSGVGKLRRRVGDGVAIISHRVAIISRGVAIISHGVAIISRGVAIISHGVAILSRGVTMFSCEVVILSRGVAIISRGWSPLLVEWSLLVVGRSV